MNSIFSFFKHIDGLLFSLVDTFKTTPLFLSLNNSFSSLSEDRQKIVNQGLTIFIVSFPIILVLLILTSNVGLRTKIETKKEILSYINKYSKNHNQLSKLSRGLKSSAVIAHKMALEEKISKLLTNRNIESSKVVVDSFSEDKGNDEFVKIETDILFTKFTSEDLANFLRGVVTKEKAKVSRINIEKDKVQNLLKGDIHLIFFAQPTD